MIEKMESKPYGMKPFAKMLERMEDLLLTGLSLPLTPWTLVNSDQLVPLLDRIRERLPDEIRQAQMILERRDHLLSESQQKAVQILEDATHQAEVMLSESELMHAVRQEADRIRQQVYSELDAHRKKTYEETEIMKAAAYEEAHQVKEGADHYAYALLNSLDTTLTESQGIVKNGQKHLGQVRAEASRWMPPTASPMGMNNLNTMAIPKNSLPPGVAVANQVQNQLQKQTQPAHFGLPMPPAKRPKRQPAKHPLQGNVSLQEGYGSLSEPMSGVSGMKPEPFHYELSSQPVSPVGMSQVGLPQPIQNRQQQQQLQQASLQPLVTQPGWDGKGTGGLSQPIVSSHTL